MYQATQYALEQMLRFIDGENEAFIGLVLFYYKHLLNSIMLLKDDFDS